MKTRFKKMFAIAACVAAFTVSAFAGYDSDTITLSTNAVLATATEGQWAKIACPGQKDVAVHIEFNMSAAATDAQTFLFARSVSGTTNDVETLSAKRTTVVVAATGTTRSVTVTNIPTYGAGYIYLVSVANANAAAVYQTNLIVKKGEKTMAP